MGSPPTRRSLLATVGTASITAVSGCLDAFLSDREGASATVVRSLESTETDRPESTQGTTNTDPTEPTRATASEPPRDGPDPFYIENHTPDTACVALTVTNQETGEVALDGTYEVAGATGVGFQEVGAVGEGYEVAATLETGEEVQDTWDVRVCPPEFRGDGLNHAGVVRIDDGNVEFVTNKCDFVIVDRPETYEWDPEPSSCSR